ELAEFLAAVEATGMGEKSLLAYRQGVERFVEFLAPRRLADSTVSDARKFIAYLGELGVTSTSLDVYRKILSFFLEHRDRPVEDATPLPGDVDVAGTAAGREEAAEWNAEETSQPVEQAPARPAPGWGFDSPVPPADA